VSDDFAGEQLSSCLLVHEMVSAGVAAADNRKIEQDQHTEADTQRKGSPPSSLGGVSPDEGADFGLGQRAGEDQCAAWFEDPSQLRQRCSRVGYGVQDVDARDHIEAAVVIRQPGVQISRQELRIMDLASGPLEHGFREINPVQRYASPTLPNGRQQISSATARVQKRGSANGHAADDLLQQSAIGDALKQPIVRSGIPTPKARFSFHSRNSRRVPVGTRFIFPTKPVILLTRGEQVKKFQILANSRTTPCQCQRKW